MSVLNSAVSLGFALAVMVVGASVLGFVGFMLYEVVGDMVARLTNTYPVHSYLTPDEMEAIRREMETTNKNVRKVDTLRDNTY